MLARRVVSAMVLAPLVVLAIYLGDGWYVAVVAAASVLANWEFYALLRRAGFAPLWPFGFALSLGFLLDAYLLPGRIAPIVLALSLTLSLLYLVARQQIQRAFVDWAVTWAPPLYAGFLLAFLVLLRQLDAGDRWVYLVVGIAWATDIGAYFVGRAVGRRRFFPRVSPRKTLEGAVGGVVAGVLCGTLLAWLFGWEVPRLLAFALLASLAAEGGDLAESLMKRQLQAKDASRLIPGHGGFLDRMDSLLFVGVATYFWAVWVGGAT